MSVEASSATRTVTAPGNASRLFRSPDEALAQPEGRTSFAFSAATGLLQNRLFDPTLVRYDDSYLTTCSSTTDSDAIATMEYWSVVARHLGQGARIVDIGCGQGEFVRELRRRGHHAIGCDPVLRVEEPPVLQRRLWADDLRGDVYVMRCVLPHMEDPWAFLHRLGEGCGGLVLVEFQRREWILECGVWAQLSHDHVTLFSAADFARCAHVVDAGTFGGGEWGWVLLDLSRPPVERPASDAERSGAVRGLDAVLAGRERRVTSLAGEAVLLWGAAGKGAVAAHALTRAEVHIRGVIDVDSRKHGLHLEGSGAPVMSPDAALRNAPAGTKVLVCNPVHLTAVRELCGDSGVEVGSLE